mmetsp:Transcript_6486/g.10229  ORF Transcript_6486/g.10229 Transcript_6486/m.10229 type:complete len:267 (-) Transcript_6486:73-873(-)
MASRLALITGSSSGIGAATARLFARSGFKVVITGRNGAALESIAADIRAELGDNAQGKVAVIVGDVTKDEDVEKVVKSSAGFSDNGKIDVLVNCAGVLQGGSMDSATMANWDYNMNTNARASFCFMINSIPFMEREKGEKTASIVNVSSVNGLQSFGGVASYCASKAALCMLSDVTAVDVASKGIRCNTVNPGVVVTELQKRGGLGDEAYKAFIERSETVTHPLGRVAQPEEVAEAILFLADSDKSDFITGTQLTIDGGRRCLGAR